MSRLLFVGLDVGSQKHWVTALHDAEHILVEEEVDHSPDALHAVALRLLELSGNRPDFVMVAVEQPNGPVVDALMAHGFKVHFINPKQLDRFRDRHSVAGAKDDRRDAYVLALSLLTDGWAFHDVHQDDPRIIKLRALMKVREDIQESLRRVTNRMREELARYHCVLVELSSGADERWVWAMWKLHPRVSRPVPTLGKIKKVLRDHRIRRYTADQVHGLFLSKRLVVRPGVEDAAAEQIELLVPQAQLLDDQLVMLGKRIKLLLDDMEAGGSDQNQEQDAGAGHNPQTTAERRSLPLYRVVAILRSFVGIGDVVLGTLLAHAHAHLTVPNRDALRAQAGLAPVTKRSGKTTFISMRRACSRELRNALHAMAQTNVMRDERSKRMYADHRARGNSHGRALRSVAERCLRIIMAMLASDTPFNTQETKA